MATTDRIDGLVTAVAIKAPVKAATTANITLSGAQTIDGVSVTAGDRVLVKDQTTGTENGIYLVATGSWTRAADADGNRDMTQGTLVTVKSSGTVNGDTIWRQTTAGSGNDGTITFGTDSVAFALAEFTVAQAAALKFNYDTSTTTGEDPGDGEFRFDNATIASVTTITFSNNSAEIGSPDVSDFIAAWDDSTNTVRGSLLVTEIGDPSVFIIFDVTGTVTDGTDYLDVTVSHVASSGSLTSGNSYAFAFSRAGDTGDVSGPGSSTDNAVARFDGTDGATIQNSGVTIDDSNNVSGIATIELGHPSDTTLARAAAGVLSVEGDQLIKSGTHTIWVPGAAMRPTVSNGCAALTDVETTAGRPDLQVLDFDASSDEHAQFQVSFPKSWNAGTVTFRVFWTSTATDTDGVTFALQGVACADGDTADVAYGTAVTVDDANQSTAEDVYVSPTSTAVTIAGSPGDDEIVFFRVFRDVSDANDTAAEDARLIGIQLFFTIDSADDS